MRRMDGFSVRHTGLVAKEHVEPDARLEEPVDQVSQSIYFVDKSHKRYLLEDLLRQKEVRRALVFSRTKHGANRIVKNLDRAGLSCAAIHSNKSQGARTRALEGFRSCAVPVLVARPSPSARRTNSPT